MRTFSESGRSLLLSARSSAAAAAAELRTQLCGTPRLRRRMIVYSYIKTPGNTKAIKQLKTIKNQCIKHKIIIKPLKSVYIYTYIIYDILYYMIIYNISIIIESIQSNQLSSVSSIVAIAICAPSQRAGGAFFSVREAPQLLLLRSSARSSAELRV